MDLLLKGSSKQMNSFAPHELQVRSFFIPPHMYTYYSDLSAIMLHAILIIFNWMLLYNTDGAEKQPHTPSPSPDKHCDILFSLMFPCDMASNNTKVNWILIVWLCAVYWRFLRIVAMLGFQASFTARGSICRPFSLSTVPCFSMTGTKRHKLHYYLCNTI